MGVNHSLCYFDNHYSTGELFPPIPMFRLKIYPRTERKLNCLPPRGQVFKVFVEFRIGTFVTFSVSNDPSQFFFRIAIKFFNSLPFLIHFSTRESNIIYKKKLRTVIGRLLSLKMLKVIVGYFPLAYALSTPFTKSFSEHQWKLKKKKGAESSCGTFTFFFHYQDVGTGFSSSLTARDNNKVLQAFLITSSTERCNIFDVNLSPPFLKHPEGRGT